MNSDLERRTAEILSDGGRVLVTRLLYLGDVILTLPLLNVLKGRFPNAEIDYLARSPGADLLEGEPIVCRVFRVPTGGRSPAAWVSLAHELRKRRYAAAIDLYSNPRSALLTRLSGAAMRIGGARRVRKRMYTHATVVPSEVRSAIEHHLYHLRPLGVIARPTRPVLTLSQSERERAGALLRSMGLDPGSETVVGIHPGGKWEVKRWPAESYAELARLLVSSRGLRVVVMVGPGEEPYGEALRAKLGSAAAYLPALPVREAAALIASLRGMVVADGGMMHVSVAVGTPTVGIFGSSEPDVWFPYEPFGPYVPAFAPIWCRPCHYHTCWHVSCLRRLRVETVIEKLVGVMDAAAQARPSAIR